MATPPVILAVISLLLLSVPTHSATCTSQTFSNNKVYSLCTDLPHLNSYLHWTYDSSNSSLSIAFTAPPAKSNGWISWGINPTATGMIGSQALIAYRPSNGSTVVQTYNISSFSPIVPGKIAFEVPEKQAVYSNDAITIFATVVLPTGTKTTVNHVWQVGPEMDGSSPKRHDMAPANLNANGTLDFMKGETVTGNSSSGAGGNSSTPSSVGPTFSNFFSSPPLVVLVALVSLLVVA
ncbi:cytochrome b561 and DOMON domain-containing protein At3g25290-like [Magnolia sinica]|uniref:cytochrome b561 and DOMON domain-containing protein At3g25290-like n=1 Tax=Magnolia sinica TaxID=86752 RepID=UPI00265A4008|nr:cytochrome b561 and DOMON domain-containing protein At3g25290-like [Magnolia sinica]